MTSNSRTKKWSSDRPVTKCLIPNPVPHAESARFSQASDNFQPGIHIDLRRCGAPKAVPGAEFARSGFLPCTKSGHRPVNGLHSIENTDSYRALFFVDSKFRRSTTGSFFDNFLSFSGWCGVRGSSAITFLIARLGRRVSKGL